MKKTLLFIALMGITATVAAQNGHNLPSARTLKSDGHAIGSRLENAITTANSVVAPRGTAFWSEDFSGGAVPAGWTNVDEGTPVGETPVTFVWSNDPGAVAPAALGYVDSEVFNAVGADNGYLWANSDRGLPAAPSTNHLTKLTTGPIDCSGQPTVQLSFSALIGVYDLDAVDFAVVRVSTDNINWTSYTAFPCLVTGAAAPPCSRWSGNPEEAVVNISATAANQPEVYIQFQWEGGWEYFWALDNITLSQLPDFERRLANVFMTHIEGGYEYARIPRNQLLSTVTLGGDVTNQGANDQTNVVVNAVVTGPNAESFSATESFPTVAVGETVTMSQVTNLPGTLSEGIYTIVYTVSSDQDASEANPANDTYTRTFELNDDVYALDGVGVHPAAIENFTSMGSESFTDAADGLEIMTYFELHTNTTIYAISALLATGTVANSSVLVSLHDTVNVIADNMNLPIAQSDVITVTAADVAAGRIVGMLPTPVDLTPNGYYASIRLLSSSNAFPIRIVDDLTVAQPGGASLIYIPGDQVYSNGNASAVRIELNPTVGMNEITELEGVSLYPNPTHGIVNVSSINAGMHAVEVTNAVGAVLLTDRFTGNTTIDLTSFAAGVYMVRVSTPAGASVTRVTLD